MLGTLNTKYQCKHIDENGCRCKRTQKILSKGLCDYHRNNKPKFKKSKSNYENGLDKFFFNQIEQLKKLPYSEHSGNYIGNPSRKNIAHILPKRYFKSVSTDPDNVLFLTWGEHSDFDNLLDKFDFNRLEVSLELGWSIAVSRLKGLLTKIPVTEQNNYYKKLKNYIENYGN